MCIIRLLVFAVGEKCAQDLGMSNKAVSSAVAHRLSEVTQCNETYTGTHYVKIYLDQDLEGIFIFGFRSKIDGVPPIFSVVQTKTLV